MINKIIKYNFPFITVFVLGFSSALPLPLVYGTLVAWLKDEGFSKTTIGFLSFISIVYSLKFFYAPFLERYKPPFLTKYFNRSKSWLIFFQLNIAIYLFLLPEIDMHNNLILFTFVCFMLVFASASQDIIVDAYRITISTKNQALGNTVANIGYRVSLLVSGAMALFLADYISWALVYKLMGFIMIVLVVLSPFLVNYDDSKLKIKKRSIFKGYINSLLSISKIRHWKAILFFVAIYKLGDAFLGVMSTPFYLELGFTKSQIAEVSKVWGLLMTFGGNFCGIYLISKLGSIRSLIWGGVLQAVSNLTYVFLAKSGASVILFTMVIAVENFTSGIGSAVFLAFLANLASGKHVAVKYALLSGIATVGRTVVSSFGGIIADNILWSNYFLISYFIALFSPLVIIIMDYMGLFDTKMNKLKSNI